MLNVILCLTKLVCNPVPTVFVEGTRIAKPLHLNEPLLVIVKNLLSFQVFYLFTKIAAISILLSFVYRLFCFRVAAFKE